jgi:hypothetical protein
MTGPATGWRPPPPPRAASDAQLVAAVAEIKGYMVAALLFATTALWFGIIVVGPIATTVLESIAPGLYCRTVECVMANNEVTP